MIGRRNPAHSAAMETVRRLVDLNALKTVPPKVCFRLCFLRKDAGLLSLLISTNDHSIANALQDIAYLSAFVDGVIVEGFARLIHHLHAIVLLC